MDFILRPRTKTEYIGKSITAIRAGDIFRIFKVCPNGASASLHYGMVGVCTGFQGENGWELDFGMGWQYTDIATDNGLGGLYKDDFIMECFMKIEVDEFRIANPLGRTRSGLKKSWFWGEVNPRMYRLSPSAARLNCYSAALFQRFGGNAGDAKKALEVTTSALLCFYSEWEPNVHHLDAKTVLINSLKGGRLLFPDSFVHIALHGMATYRISGAEGLPDNDYARNTTDEVSLLDESDGQLIDTVIPAQSSYGVFPSMCAHKLINVYSNIKYSDLGKVATRDNDIEYALSISNILADFTDKRELKTRLTDVWRPLTTLIETNDFISRYARDEGSLTGYWSVVGTRVHRKCYLQALCNREYLYTPQFLQSDTHKKRDNDIVAITNSCMVLDTPDLDNDIVTDMYEKIYNRVADEAGCPDAILLEHFTENMISLTKSAIDDEFRVLSPEFPVYWPFGLFSKRANELGRAYETRIDLLLVDDSQRVVLVEYKTRMEISEHGRSVYALSDPNDRLQLRLNMWMFYLNTGIQVGHAYIVQASRNQTPGKVNGCIARIIGTTACWQGFTMLNLITRFALNPYGPNSVARYSDKTFIVPNMTELMGALGIIGKFNINGTHPIFTDILCASCFNRVVAKVAGFAVPPTVLYLPNDCITGAGDAHVLSECMGSRNKFSNLNDNWRHYHALSQTTNIQSAAFRYGEFVDGCVQFVPVLFNSENKPILYCNVSSELVIKKLIVQSPANASGPIVTLNNPAIFRKNLEGVSLRYRINLEPDRAAADPYIRKIAFECAKKRDKLNKEVVSIAKRINEFLIDYKYVQGGSIHNIGVDDLWDATTNGIYRLQLQNLDGPVVHEFDTNDSDLFGPLPKNLITQLDAVAQNNTDRTLRNLPRRYTDKLSEIRLSLLIRCIHRIINTRVLRASMAMCGFSDVQRDRIAQGQSDWTIEGIEKWKRDELDLMIRVFRSEAASMSWWEQRNGSATRQHIFPHMSQRAMWNPHIFDAVHSDLHTIEGHVRNDVLNDCIRILSTQEGI